MRRGHTVTVATTRLAGRKALTHNGVAIEEFSISGNEARGYSGETPRYQDFLLTGSFDIMMNYAAQQWSTDLALPILEHIPCKKVLAPCGFSGLYDTAYREYFAHMPERLKHYDHLVFHSQTYRDAEFADRHGLHHYSLIPNGASEEEFGKDDPGFRQKYGIPDDVSLLIAVSNHTPLKGHKLVLDAFRLARIDRAVLLIIGKPFGRLRCLPACKLTAWGIRMFSSGKKVSILDLPRSDVLAAYHAGDIFLHGSQLECSPLVLFEAMASKTPFITTNCGNAKEIVSWGHGGIAISGEQTPEGIVISRPGDMARAIEDLAADPSYRRQLGENGYRAWKARFTWEHIATHYERLYRVVVEERNPGR